MQLTNSGEVYKRTKHEHFHIINLCTGKGGVGVCSKMEEQLNIDNIAKTYVVIKVTSKKHLFCTFQLSS